MEELIKIINEYEKVTLEENEQGIVSIHEFFEKLNRFLNNKHFSINIDDKSGKSIKNFIFLKSGEKVLAADEEIARILSSGESQFIPMLYQANLSLDTGLLVVDEPEISLDVEWQSELGNVFSKKKDCQIICFTHSYSFSESFNYSEEMFHLVQRDNTVKNIRSAEL